MLSQVCPHFPLSRRRRQANQRLTHLQQGATLILNQMTLAASAAAQVTRWRECYKLIAASKTASEKRKAPRNKGKPKSKTALIATDAEDDESTAEPEAFMNGY